MDQTWKEIKRHVKRCETDMRIDGLGLERYETDIRRARTNLERDETDMERAGKRGNGQRKR